MGGRMDAGKKRMTEREEDAFKYVAVVFFAGPDNLRLQERKHALNMYVLLASWRTLIVLPFNKMVLETLLWPFNVGVI